MDSKKTIQEARTSKNSSDNSNSTRRPPPPPPKKVKFPPLDKLISVDE